MDGVEITMRELPCGLRAYDKLVVPHDWKPAPLNRCECGKPISRWTIGRGHECDCGKTCNGACR